MDTLATGQCLCGAVKFRISGEFESFFLCHPPLFMDGAEKGLA